MARDGIPRAFDGLLEEPTYLYIRGDERNPDKSRVILPGVPAILAFDEVRVTPISLPLEAWQPERRPRVADAELSAARSRLTAEEAARQKAANKFAEADEELAVAEASLGVAQAEFESVTRRVAAHWGESNATDEARAELAAAAVRAERQLLVARSQHRVAVAEQGARRAASDQKEAAEKTLRTEREGLEKSFTVAAADGMPTDTYTRFVGAMSTPTRFFNSGKDDPEVKFQPRSSGRRTALANWMTDRRNPLTARVAVNHIWTRHMGQPLVPTMFDFGRQGTPPTHPELLDWLASELIDSGWSMKYLHEVITHSAAYRLGSSVRAENADGGRGREGAGEIAEKRARTRRSRADRRAARGAIGGRRDVFAQHVPTRDRHQPQRGGTCRRPAGRGSLARVARRNHRRCPCKLRVGTD